MKARTEKADSNKSNAVARAATGKQEKEESGDQFEDKRVEVVAQRKLAGLADASPQAGRVAQMQAVADGVNFGIVQRAEDEEEENGTAQPKFGTAQRVTVDEEDSSVAQKKDAQSQNNTGLPDTLKSGIENLSGCSMDDVKVHYNSAKPAQLQAHAFAQGTDIHMAPGQEKHLPHEAWHVVQQKQGRVKPTKQLKGKVNVNDDAGLEKEADVMGGMAKLIASSAPSEHAPDSPKSIQLASAKLVPSYAPTQVTDVGPVQMVEALPEEARRPEDKTKPNISAPTSNDKERMENAEKEQTTQKGFTPTSLVFALAKVAIDLKAGGRKGQTKDDVNKAESVYNRFVATGLEDLVSGDEVAMTAFYELTGKIGLWYASEKKNLSKKFKKALKKQPPKQGPWEPQHAGGIQGYVDTHIAGTCTELGSASAAAWAVYLAKTMEVPGGFIAGLAAARAKGESEMAQMLKAEKMARELKLKGIMPVDVSADAYVSLENCIRENKKNGMTIAGWKKFYRETLWVDFYQHLYDEDNKDDAKFLIANAAKTWNSVK